MSNPSCEFGVEWDTFHDADTGLHGTRVVIEKPSLVPNQYLNLPDHVTVAVQTTDGRHFTQDAYVGNGATDKWDSVAEKGLQLSHRRPGRHQRGLDDDEQWHVLGGRKPIVRFVAGAAGC
jgi:hypothetical protein